MEGWRAWIVPSGEWFGHSPKLLSISTYYVWDPRRLAMVFCEICGPDAPGERCGCGFYSAKSVKHLLSMNYHQAMGDTRVIGRVLNAGKVVEGSSGWRAACAYPDLLLVPHVCWKLVKPLSESYGVPVRLVNFLASPREATKRIDQILMELEG